MCNFLNLFRKNGNYLHLFFIIKGLSIKEREGVGDRYYFDAFLNCKFLDNG